MKKTHTVLFLCLMVGFLVCLVFYLTCMYICVDHDQLAASVTFLVPTVLVFIVPSVILLEQLQQLRQQQQQYRRTHTLNRPTRYAQSYALLLVLLAYMILSLSSNGQFEPAEIRNR